jgi:4-hydroxy-3-methylbut-2-enyl diphosphate reductase
MINVLEAPHPDYTKIEFDDSVLSSGRMVDLVGNREFCGGINAMTEVVNIYREAGLDQFFINHPPSHNPDHTKDLESKGLIVEPDPANVPPGNVYMASPHGAPKGLSEIVEAHGLDFVDLTCVFVRTVQLGVAKDDEHGRLTIYSGQKGHQEQLAVSSYRSDPDSFVTIYSEEEAEQMLPWILANRYGREITFRQQTTHSAITHDRIENVLRREIKDLKVPPKRDTCRAVRHRQQSVLAQIPKGIDLVLSVGGPNSHNTKELANIAVQAGEGVDGYSLRDASGLDDAWLQGKKHITLTGGASTPPESVNSVKKALLEKGDTVRHLRQLFPEPIGETFAYPKSVEATLMARGLPLPQRLIDLRSRTR